MDYPFVSIIIPCRNEEKFIGQCLDSIIDNDYPKDRMEILIIDGLSQDKTREIINKYSESLPFIKLIDNPKKIVPSALNIGIKDSKGDIIIRMDAHNTYENNYISKCIKYLYEYDVDNVGGIWKTLPGEDTITAKSISIVLSHPFGVGNAHFRIGSKMPKYVDTVPFGCYRKSIFDRIGVFNENLTRNQDIEFNIRLKRAGGKILLVPDIISHYHARPTLKALAKNNFLNGFWVLYGLKFAKLPFSIRHLVPLIFVISLVVSIIFSLIFDSLSYLFLFIMSCYLLSNIYFSLRALPGQKYKYLIPIMLSFMTLHLSYGVGSIWGLIKLILPGKK